MPLYDLGDTVDWGKKWLDFNARKMQLVLLDKSNNTGTIDVKINRSIVEEKSFFKMLGLHEDTWRYIISNAKSASKKIGALVHSRKFLSPEVALYLYKFIMDGILLPCLAGDPSCYLELLDLLNSWLIVEM